MSDPGAHAPGPSSTERVVIAGAGPAGLTAAWVLNRGGIDAEVHEADPRHVGGIARTETYEGFRFDIGGHRFFTKADEVHELWAEMLPPEEWLHVQRMSRIFYRGRFFDYPLKASDALRKLGIVESVLCVLSYLKARVFPRRDVRSFEDWIVNHFGQRLYRIFFKTYTEKVWGRPCSEISADWAAQRIKGLSLLSAIRNALPAIGKGKDEAVIKTLIEVFDYPRYGPGQLWEHAAERLRDKGCPVELGSRIVEVHHEQGLVTHLVVERDGERRAIEGRDYIATIPLRELVHIMHPPAPASVQQAAMDLHYRDYLTVVLVVDQAEVFPDNWIYIHEPEVELGRIQNYKNWSSEMVPDSSQTALGLEYFTTAGDKHLWERSDDDLRQLGIREASSIGLVDASKVVDATVVRMPKAYPVYDEHYRTNVGVIRAWLDVVAKNLQTVGRNGMHKYNNQDHSMMAAQLAARNLLGEDWDPWKVNTDGEYHEEVLETDDQAARRIPGKTAPLE